MLHPRPWPIALMLVATCLPHIAEAAAPAKPHAAAARPGKATAVTVRAGLAPLPAPGLAFTGQTVYVSATAGAVLAISGRVPF